MPAPYFAGTAIQAAIVTLWGAFIAALPGIIGRIALALGISSVTYTGFSMVVGSFKDDLIARFSNLPVLTLDILGVLQVGAAVNIIFSAFLAKAAISGYSSVSKAFKVDPSKKMPGWNY